jgi:hypothetical protein
VGGSVRRVLLDTCVAGNYYPNLSPAENEPPVKALFLGTLAASQATPIIEFDLTRKLAVRDADSSDRDWHLCSPA